MVAQLTDVHVMLDLETMGLTPGCAIISVGAVKFNFSHGILDQFKRNITEESCLRAGLFINLNTRAWWDQQSDEAKAALKDPEPIELMTALSEFNEWIGKDTGHVWSHGAASDIPWIEAAYRSVNVPYPWGHRAPRDTRTIQMLSEILEIPSYEDMGYDIPTVKHCALNDAIFQAHSMIHAVRTTYVVLGK